MIAVSNKFTMFVVPNIANRIDSRLTYNNRNKAGFLFDDSTSVDSRCLATSGDSASFVVSIPQVFRTMPNTENLKATAQGASVSRIPTKRGIKPYSQLKGEESPRKHLYKVRIDGYGRWRKSDSSSDHTADIYHTDIYEATSISEALGMAIEAVQKEHPFCDIYARRGNVKLLNSLA